MITLKEGRLRSVFAIEKNDTSLPANSVVLGSNGQFEVSGSDCFKFIRPITNDGAVQLQKIEPGVEVVTKISWSDFWKGPAWLRKQWDKHCINPDGSKSGSKEFIILLFFNPTTKQYLWFPPKQKGSSASLNYTTSDDEDIQRLVGQGLLLVGTMHNHFGKGTAFQSGTDKHDEAKHGMPMIHFTMGWMDAPYLYCSEFHIRFVAGEYEKLIDFEDIVDTANNLAPADATPPQEWDEKLSIEYSPTTTVVTSSSSSGFGTPSEFRGFGGFSKWGRESKECLRRLHEDASKGIRIRSSRHSGKTEKDSVSAGWSHVDSEEAYYTSQSIYEGPDEDEDPLIVTKTVLSEAGTSTNTYKSVSDKYPKVEGFLGGKSLLIAFAALTRMADEFEDVLESDKQGIAVIEWMEPMELMAMLRDTHEAMEIISVKMLEFIVGQQNMNEKEDEKKEVIGIVD